MEWQYQWQNIIKFLIYWKLSKEREKNLKEKYISFIKNYL